jgi:hypothetical protein
VNPPNPLERLQSHLDECDWTDDPSTLTGDADAAGAWIVGELRRIVGFIGADAARELLDSVIREGRQ